MNALKNSLAMTLAWYRQSDVMLPADGSWGVAERVLLTAGNQTAEITKAAFPACSDYGTHTIIEQRRPDCNFQAALLHLLASEILEDPAAAETAHNILNYLYCRSGMLLRTVRDHYTQVGVWTWSNICWLPTVYFDDNAWVCYLQLALAKMRPDWDAAYDMKTWGLRLADDLAAAFRAYFPTPPEPPWDLKHQWLGTTTLPHWGSLVCMALARAYTENRNPDYPPLVAEYHRYLLDKADTFTTSEFGYAVLGAMMSHRAFGDELSLQTARCFADKICTVMADDGSIPSQHYEAPAGGHLADTIYTLNWAVLALQEMKRQDEKYTPYFKRLLTLLLNIQDRSPEPFLHGCWRGMYDMAAGKWGGGDCFEGGANSIYTGWTNAPIPWAIAFEQQGTSLTDY